MINIELTNDEVEKIIGMIEGSSIQMVNAEDALVLYKKFKEAKV